MKLLIFSFVLFIAIVSLFFKLVAIASYTTEDAIKQSLKKSMQKADGSLLTFLSKATYMYLENRYLIGIISLFVLLVLIF